MVATTGAHILGAEESKTSKLLWQQKAWRFYGTPDGTAIANLRSNQGAIGEVRFVMGWIAQQIGRIQWHVEIDGVRLDDAEAAALMDRVSNEESTIIVSTNLIVAGELNYCAMTEEKIERLNGDPKWEALAGPSLPGDDDAKWMAVSVVDNHREDLLNEADLNLRAIWPHPGKPTVADPPFRGVIDVLEEIEQIQDLAYSQNRSRIAQMGILTVANEFDLASPSGDFGTDFELTINAQIVDPRKASASPILVRGPIDLMGGTAQNRTGQGVQWTRPVNDFDERLDDKMRFQIQRLAWGFPVAPEILLGMTATNRAVAFQIEETTYRSHIEPIARLVGRVYAGALKMILEKEGQKVKVIPDATELLARRHSVADAKDAYDRGLASAEWVRRVLGIDEEDAATDEDIRRIILLRKGGNPGQGREPDPSEVSGNEPVRASAAVVDDLGASLRGAVDLALSTVVSRIGAAARTKMTRQGPTPDLGIDADGVPNSRLPSLLGPDRLAELELDLESAICAPLDSLLLWWHEQIMSLTDEASVIESVETLRTFFKYQCLNWSCSWPIVRVRDDFTGPVLAAVQPKVLESTPESGGL